VQLSDEAERKLTDQRMKEWSRDQEEYAFAERKREEDKKKREQNLVGECTELFREVAFAIKRGDRKEERRMLEAIQEDFEEQIRETAQAKWAKDLEEVRKREEKRWEEEQLVRKKRKGKEGNQEW
jgi:hypothetical protein